MFFGFLRGLPNEQVGRNRGAKNRDQRRQKRAVQLNFWDKKPAEGLTPGYMLNGKRNHVCVSAWNKDPVFGVIGIQSGPRH